MGHKKKYAAVALAVAGALAAGGAGATNGYFSHGYGMKAKGMGGVATARAVDAFGGANNPASMVWAGDRIDFGVDLFSPRREASRSGSAPALGPIDGSVDSDSNYFLIPEFGYNKMIKPNMSMGVTVYGNGGMNTDYAGGQIPAASFCGGIKPTPGPKNMLCGDGRLGVDLVQLVIAPTLAYKVTPNHSFGISPLIAFQRFKIEGAQGFSGFSTSPANLTNNGHDNSHGFGVRLGWFDKYKGLFAEQGGFDIPVNYNFGVAYKATPKLTVAADYQRINYSGVKSVGNPSSNLAGCFGGNVANCLGGSAGAGFGWRDINVVKVGFEYEYSQRLTLRAGYDRSQNPIRSSDVTINILAPGIVQDHLTFGLTHKTSTGGELTVSYMHAFSKTVSGPSFFNGFTAPLSSGSETIKMHQDSIGIAYGWKM